MPRTLLDKRNEKHIKLKVLLSGTIRTREKSADEIGKILGVSGRTINRYLKTPEKLSVEMVEKLGRNLHIPLDELRSCITY